MSSVRSLGFSRPSVGYERGAPRPPLLTPSRPEQLQHTGSMLKPPSSLPKCDAQASSAGAARSTTSSPSHARAQGDEKLVQLLELLGHPTLPARGTVESFLRGIELVQDHQRLASFFLEGHRRDLPSVTSFVVGPDEARVRGHFEVRAKERHGL